MTVPSLILAEQARALHELLEQERRRRCESETEAAAQRATALLRAARSDARRRVAAAVREERARSAEALQRAEAARDTRRRAAEQASLDVLMSGAWGALPRALEARWASGPDRALWWRTTLDLAARVLRAVPWSIELAPGADEIERAAILAGARERRPAAHTLALCPELRAGLRIRSIGAVLDATPEGLLDEREAVLARFAAEWLQLGEVARPLRP